MRKKNGIEWNRKTGIENMIIYVRWIVFTVKMDKHNHGYHILLSLSEVCQVSAEGHLFRNMYMFIRIDSVGLFHFYFPFVKSCL